MRRVCVIGAGSSGIAACQALHGRGIPFDCFEAGSSVGGNWRYNNDNGMSSAYRSLHAKSSRRGMQYAAFPMPGDYPDYLSHEMIARYLDDFVDHFGFRGSIRFRTEVTRAEPVAEIQAQWVADLLEGRAVLPPEPEMNREISAYRAATARRYARSSGYAIHVDFLPYLREIRKERAARARRGRARRALAAGQVPGSSRRALRNGMERGSLRTTMGESADTD